MDEFHGVMVFGEQRNGKIHPVSYELLGKGREIADTLGVELSCVLLGDKLKTVARELIYYGADKVYLYQNPELKNFNMMNYRQNIVNLVNEVKPGIFLLGATNLGRSLGPRLATALRTGLTADCTALEVADGGTLIQIRPAFSGSILAHIKTSTRPQMSTVRYRVMRTPLRDNQHKGEVVLKDVELVPQLLTLLKKESSGEISIADADIIVSGGRGLKKPDDFAILAELAELLGGVVGASRPMVDSGWIGREHQVGFSGNTVKPKVYFAVGISGSAQHLAGMRNSDIIIAVNTDPSAPIFRMADYGIVGDLYQVIPKIIAEIKRRRP